MPIKIPNALPATDTLRSENIFVMTETRAMTQDIRPLQILLLNLMPTKIDTETQLARVLGNTPLQIELELIAPAGHVSKNTSQEHMLAFYKTFDQVKHRTFDGLIITGAPVEMMDFEEVDYWPELCEIMEWSKTHAHSTLHICWGAQAGLYYHYGIRKQLLPEKLFGVFRHTVEDPNYILFRGFDDKFWVPHSRNTTVHREDIEAIEGLKVLSASPEAGVYAVKSPESRQVFLMGHAEYDPDTKTGMPGSSRKVKGTLHWVSCDHCLKAEVRLYDRLWKVENPRDEMAAIREAKNCDALEAMKEMINEDSLKVLTECYVEKFLADAKPLDYLQFQRIGYFNVDKDSTSDHLVFNRTVSLKDTWSKINK